MRLLFLFSLSFILFSFGDSKSTRHHLFEIERSVNQDKIVYDIQIEHNNSLNRENPIRIYWVRNKNKMHIEPLTWIQKNYAYGLRYITVSRDFAQFHFVSYPKRIFTIKRNKTGVFKVFTTSNQKEVELCSIFIQIDGGTFWFPKISFVELQSIDTKTGEKTL